MKSSTDVMVESLLQASKEYETLEFKAATNSYQYEKLVEYCVALANEGGGRFVLGITDKPPREVCGTAAFADLNEVKRKLFDKLHIRVSVAELTHAGKRVLVFNIPSRPSGTPLHFDGKYLMRVGESLMPMSSDHLRAILDENLEHFLDRVATDAMLAQAVLDLLDVQAFFSLIGKPFPDGSEKIMAQLAKEKLVVRSEGQFCITNLGALLLAKDITEFPGLKHKRIRVTTYDSTNKVAPAIRDIQETKGYACGFEGLVDYVKSQLPDNEYIESALRTTVPLYPEIALREFIANAMIHQDFDLDGIQLTIGIYADRIEIKNPGAPLIAVERFVDEERTRNAEMSDLMRRLRICELRGSGVDRALTELELHQLPAPRIASSETYTRVTLIGRQEFAKMNLSERIWTAYLHCVLRYLSSDHMTNASLRKRFGLGSDKSSTTSQVISAAVEHGLIKQDLSYGISKKYARYIPSWA